MPLVDKLSGKTLASAIEVVSSGDYRWIKNSKNFKFKWKAEQNLEVYKIFLLDDDEEILGLMSLIDVLDEYRIHLNLIESSEEQRGSKKKIENIAGCLIAFACKVAFARGYDGFVSLQPKTKLIDYYQDNYNFRQYGRLLGVEQDLSRQLILKYLTHEKDS